MGALATVLKFVATVVHGWWPLVIVVLAYSMMTYVVFGGMKTYKLRDRLLCSSAFVIVALVSAAYGAVGEIVGPSLALGLPGFVGAAVLAFLLPLTFGMESEPANFTGGAAFLVGAYGLFHLMAEPPLWVIATGIAVFAFGLWRVIAAVVMNAD